jgi:hypothetical protein
VQAFYVVLVLGLGKGKGELDRLRFGSGVRFRFRIRTSWFAARTGRAGRGLEGVGGRPVGHPFGLRAAAAWPRGSVSGRSSAGPVDGPVTGYGLWFRKKRRPWLRLWVTIVGYGFRRRSWRRFWATFSVTFLGDDCGYGFGLRFW